MTVFTTDPGKRRKRGSGCVTLINGHLWKSRYLSRKPDISGTSEMSAAIPRRRRDRSKKEKTSYENKNSQNSCEFREFFEEAGLELVTS